MNEVKFSELIETERLKRGDCSSYTKQTVIDGQAINIEKECTINTQ